MIVNNQNLFFKGRHVDFIDHPRLGKDITRIHSSVLFVDDRDRPMNWCSIFPFTDATILQNLIDHKTFPFDLNVRITNIFICLWISLV